MQRRMFTAFAAVGFGVVLTVASAPNSFAAPATGAGTAAFPVNGTINSADIGECKTIDFKQAQVTPLPDVGSSDRAVFSERYRLTVTGTKAASNYSVELVPLVYDEQPTYWRIDVRACASGVGLPVLTPYTAVLDFYGTMGTCGIEVRGARTSEQIDLAGCRPVSLSGTRWMLDPASLEVPVPSGSPIKADFTDRQVSGSTSCNTYFADYSVGENGAFAVGSIGVTKKACESVSAKAEAVFLARLSRANQVLATRAQLRLLEDGKVLLRFVPVKSVA